MMRAAAAQLPLPAFSIGLPGPLPGAGSSATASGFGPAGSGAGPETTHARAGQAMAGKGYRAKHPVVIIPGMAISIVVLGVVVQSVAMSPCAHKG